MAAGSIVVDLLLRTGSFESDTDRAARAARKFEKEARAAAAGVASASEVSAKQTAAAFRVLPAQFTDIATQLAGGANPALVLLQQGGQIKDSFGGIRPAAAALLSILSPTAVAFGAVAAAIVGVSAAAIEGANDDRALRESFAKTGNVAGLTAGSVDKLAHSLADSGKVTIGAAREITQSLVGLGNLGPQSLEAASRATAALSRATGESTDEIVKSFAGASAAPTAFAAKLNAAYNFLNVETFKQVRALEAQGRQQEAVRLTLDSLANTMEQRSIPSLGLFQRAWRSTKEAASDFWDVLKGIGRDTTLDEQVAILEQRAKSLRVGGAAAQRNLDGLLNLRGRDQIRAVDRGIDQAAQNKKIEEESAAHQAALAALADAGAAKQLAQQRQYLSARESALRLSFQRDEAAAADYQAALLKIDLDRIAAQDAALAGQRQREAARPTSNPDEVLQQQARLLQIDAQRVALAEQRGRVLAAERAGERDIAPKPRSIGPADALKEFKAQDEANVESFLQNEKLREEANREFLRTLEDDTRRAAIDLIGDEQARGEALIALDREVAERRISQQLLTEEQKQRALKAVQTRSEISQQLLSERNDPLMGAARGVEDYLNRVKAAGDATREAIGTGLSTLEDDISNSLASGKPSIANFVNYAISQIYRLGVVRPFLQSLFGENGGNLSSLINAVGNFFGGEFGGNTNDYRGTTLPDSMRGGAATGTNMLQRDMVTLVHKGEAIVPEPFNPWAGGRGLGGGTPSVTVINNLGVQAAARTERQRDGSLRVVLDAMKGAIADDYAQGGMLARTQENVYGSRRAPQLVR